MPLLTVRTILRRIRLSNTCAKAMQSIGTGATEGKIKILEASTRLTFLWMGQPKFMERMGRTLRHGEANDK